MLILIFYFFYNNRSEIISNIGLIIVGITILYLIYHLYMKISTPVSMPGPPRKHRIFRQPKWDNKEHFVNKGWKFYSDMEGHKATEKELKKHKEIKEYKLTGESAGRSIWIKNNNINTLEQFSFNPSINPNSKDKIFRAQKLKEWTGKLPDENFIPKTANDAAKKGIEFYQILQCSEGHWAGDYGGPMFLMPGLIITCYISKNIDIILGKERMKGMIQYLRSHQQSDGGWGTHIESPSTMFGTVLCYVAMRLLGVSKNDKAIIKARKFIHDNGGALYTSSWAKFWLSCLGVYEWEGVNSIPAEMWLFPYWFPLHPGKMWCHCRMVYLPMCYLYCTRFQADVTDDIVLQSLRKELFIEDYNTIDWANTRHLICEYDNYSKVHWLMKFLHWLLSFYEKAPFKYLRNKALKFVYDYIEAEDLQTNYNDIGPVNKAANMLWY